VKGEVIADIDGIRPLLEVEVVETIMVWTDNGWLGDEKTPIVIVVEGI